MHPSPFAKQRSAVTATSAASVENQTATIRETTKWLIGAFAAVGATILASLKFSDIGQVSGPSRWVAIGLAAVSLLAVAVALIMAARVLSSDATSAAEVLSNEELRKRVEAGGLVTLSEYHSRDFDSPVKYLWKCYQDRVLTLRNIQDSGVGLHDVQHRRTLASARVDVESCRLAEHEVLSYATYLQARDGFRAAQRALWAAGATVFICCVGFTVVISDAISSQREILGMVDFKSPMPVDIAFRNSDDEQAFNAARHCTQTPRTGWLIGGNFQRPIVLIPATIASAGVAGCGAIIHRAQGGELMVTPRIATSAASG
jgi:hypothetical protein